MILRPICICLNTCLCASLSYDDNRLIDSDFRAFSPDGSCTIFSNWFIKNLRIESLLLTRKVALWAFLNDKMRLSRLAFVSWVGSDELSKRVSSLFKMDKTQDYSCSIYSFIESLVLLTS